MRQIEIRASARGSTLRFPPGFRESAGSSEIPARPLHFETNEPARGVHAGCFGWFVVVRSGRGLVFPCFSVDSFEWRRRLRDELRNRAGETVDGRVR